MVRKQAKRPSEHPDDQRVVYTVGIVDPQDGRNYRAVVSVDMQRFGALVAALVYGNVPAQMEDEPGPMETEFGKGAIRVKVKRTRGVPRGNVVVKVRTFEVTEGEDDAAGDDTEEWDDDEG